MVRAHRELARRIAALERNAPDGTTVREAETSGRVQRLEQRVERLEGSPTEAPPS